MRIKEWEEGKRKTMEVNIMKIDVEEKEKKRRNERQDGWREINDE